MRKIRLDKKVALFYTTVATAVGSGGYLYGTEYVRQWQEENALQEKSAIVRDELATYLPLTQEMVGAVPYADYPPGLIGGGGMMMSNYNLTLAESLDRSQRYLKQLEDGKNADDNACETLSYLRAIHKIATAAYESAAITRDDIDLPAHKLAAAQPDRAAPSCGYAQYEPYLVDGGTPDDIAAKANMEIGYLALQAQFANEGAPPYFMQPQERAAIIKTAIDMVGNATTDAKKNCTALIDLRHATDDARMAHFNSHSKKSPLLSGESPVARSSSIAQSCNILFPDLSR